MRLALELSPARALSGVCAKVRGALYGVIRISLDGYIHGYIPFNAYLTELVGNINRAAQ